jgi:AcrR family transcriptional regulator
MAQQATHGLAAQPDRADQPIDGRRLRWAEHRARRRAALVDAGASAIDVHGPDASAEQIADAAGVSRTVLYRYFHDRDELRQAIADETVVAVVASVVPKLRLTPGSTPRQTITPVIEVIVGWLDEHPNLYYLLRDRRSGSGLEAVTHTLADHVAALLTMFLMLFGIDGERAEPSAYGIVGFVESTGSWWLAKRTMSRNALITIISHGVWCLLDGTLRENNVVVGYDDPLPVESLRQLGSQRQDA